MPSPHRPEIFLPRGLWRNWPPQVTIVSMIFTAIGMLILSVTDYLLKAIIVAAVGTWFIRLAKAK